jgi:hypothetical protein
LKFWEGHCKISTDNSANGIAKFFRQNFLRSYYNNRAPYVINLISDWLKVDIVKQDTHLTRSGKKMNYTKKYYRNLDGVKKFINETLRNNKDVYFVTAYQALKWTQNLKYLEANYQNFTNITEYLHEFILSNDDNSDCPKVNYNGECEYLKHKTLDYNKTIEMNDVDNEDDDRKEIKDLKTLLEIQSEFLFLNNVITYLSLILIASLIIIFIYDKIYV